MQPIQMVDLRAQYQEIKPEVDAAIAATIDACSFINGPQVSSFEQNLAQYLDCHDVISCANGTDALQIALMALDLQPGDEVITAPFTFIATAEVISLLRLKPVFVDVEEDTFNLDPALLEAAITERTKCIIPVHLFGQCSNMERIMAIANQHGVPVVEDNAQSIGADYTFADGKKMKSGTMGAIGCTSFFPSKNLGAYGDGGALYTNDAALAAKIRVIRNHGSKVKYFHSEVGVNSRLDSMQAAVLDIKLRKLDDYCARRAAAAAKYDAAFADMEGIETPVRHSASTHVFHQYTMKIADGQRDALQAHLKANKVPAMVYYPVPLHIQEAYAYCGYQNGDFPVSERVAKQVLSLPMHTELSDEQIQYIIEQVQAFFKS